MMLDIFSSFDPFIHLVTEKFPNFFWCLILIPVIFFLSYWQCYSSISMMPIFFVKVIMEQVNRTVSKFIVGTSSYIMSIFVMIIVFNMTGLVPYIFSFSSHLSLTLMMGLPMWLTLIISGASYNFSHFVGSLLPGGAPVWMNPVLVLIESVSILVRPLTLSFRLAANMSAGHIVLSLMGVYSAAAFISSMNIMLLFLQVFYLGFEVGIGLIQAYIFCLLLTLYSDDHYH